MPITKKIFIFIILCLSFSSYSIGPGGTLKDKTSGSLYDAHASFQKSNLRFMQNFSNGKLYFDVTSLIPKKDRGGVVYEIGIATLYNSSNGKSAVDVWGTYCEKKYLKHITRVEFPKHWMKGNGKFKDTQIKEGSALTHRLLKFNTSREFQLFSNNLCEIVKNNYELKNSNGMGRQKVYQSGDPVAIEMHERVTQQIMQQKNISNNNQNIVIDLEDAKKECKEIGFKEKTEKFGNCVLKLSK